MSGDQILEIDGKPTKGMRLDDAIGRLKGEAGSTVALTVGRPGRKETETITLKREIVRIETVLGDQRAQTTGGTTGRQGTTHRRYVRVTGFGRNTNDELKTALRELRKQKFAGLILDLRLNPGGLLSRGDPGCGLVCVGGQDCQHRGAQRRPAGLGSRETRHLRRFSDGRPGQSL